ncbi:MAG: VWA domain-containing protein [Chloroflexi bacterium]|nr:MAG: VWA domain-containing protein [Chloroflexota bacterium]
MEFQWPGNLWLLAVVAALLFAYVFVQRRRRRYALRYASLQMVRTAVGPGPGIRRHVPPALFLLGFTALVLAIARPAMLVKVPGVEGTVILAIDVSGSMAADDVKPNRMEAAKEAAKTFVEQQRLAKNNVRIGVVTFSDNAQVVMGPTLDRTALIDAIDRLKPQRSTALGKAIIVSLDAIYEGQDVAPGDPDDQQSTSQQTLPGRTPKRRRSASSIGRRTWASVCTRWAWGRRRARSSRTRGGPRAPSSTRRRSGRSPRRRARSTSTRRASRTCSRSTRTSRPSSSFATSAPRSRSRSRRSPRRSCSAPHAPRFSGSRGSPDGDLTAGTESAGPDTPVV